MTILDCYQYVLNRLNSSSSNSGDNIQKYHFVEAFNTAQSQWVEDRIKLSESSIIRIDEVQQLLKTVKLKPLSKTDLYTEFKLPKDYLHYKRSTSEPCQLWHILVKEGDVNLLLQDDNWKPSLEWGETLCTLIDNKLRVYRDNFSVNSVDFVYYRTPILVNLSTGHTDVNGNPTSNIDPEFQNSSLIEILNLSCRILAGDSGDQVRYQPIGNLIQAHT